MYYISIVHCENQIEMYVLLNLQIWIYGVLYFLRVLDSHNPSMKYFSYIALCGHASFFDNIDRIHLEHVAVC